jgi:AAA15 family ATPase/GTPase
MTSRQAEKIKVNGFLSIKDVEVTLGNITAIIGPQASGKSIIAKLVYFGRMYLSEFLEEAVREDFNVASFRKSQLEKFLSIFDGLEGFSSAFTIEYTYGRYELKIFRGASRRKPTINHNKAVEKDFGTLQKEFQKFRGGSEEKPRRPVSRLAFRRENALARELYSTIPTCLFVPAARSFYSTISEELFTFLASEERIDPLISQFGSFYEFAKRRVTGDWYSADFSSTEKEKLKDVIMPVIGGEYVREKSKDYIKTNWGRVPLRVSSSGQQEALPLLVALSQYPAALFGNKEQPRLLVVEEPEAHLFPTAQKYILDFMVSIASEHDCDILCTSHSPYR